MQEWQDSQFLDRADSGAIAAVHDAALVHILVGCLTALMLIVVNVLALGTHGYNVSHSERFCQVHRQRQTQHLI